MLLFASVSHPNKCYLENYESGSLGYKQQAVVKPQKTLLKHQQAGSPRKSILSSQLQHGGEALTSDMEWKLAVAEHLKHRKWKKDSMLLATKANIAHEVVASVQRKLAKAFASEFFPFSPSNTQGQVEQILVSVTSQPMAVVESSSRVQLFVAPWTAAHQASPSFTISQSLPKFLVLASVMPSSHLIL